MDIRKHRKVFYAFVILFSLYFGYSLTPKNPDLDSSRIIEIFQSWDSLFPSFSDFLREFTKFNNPYVKDLFEGLVFFFVHTISDNYHLIFLCCAFVFSIYKLKVFNYFLRDYKYNFPHIILVFAFFTSIPLFEINGFRFFTASWVALYATLRIIVDHNKRYLYLLALTPLIHITFLFYLLMFVLSYAASKKINERIIALLFIVSVIVSMLWNTLPNIGNMGDNVFGNLLSSYINNDYKAEIDTAVQESHFIKLFNPLRYLYYNAIALILYINCKENEQKKFMRFLLVCLSIANVVGFIPSMSRFFAVLTPLILIQFNKEVNYNKKIRLLVYLLPLVEMFRIYQIYFDLYPDVLPNGFLTNIILI